MPDDRSPVDAVAMPCGLLATIALCWMLGVVLYLGTQVWTALNVGRNFGLEAGTEGTWFRLLLLSQTGQLTISFAALGGLLLVLFAGASRARAASVLGIAVGLWTVVAGALGVAVAFHGNAAFPLTTLTDNRFVFGLANAADIVLGVVVAMLGARLLAAGGGLTDAATSRGPTEPEIAELS